MKFSIIVPVYNVEKYISKCLKSILNQSLEDFECLIIDDGSEDNSIEIANDLIKNDARFTIYHKENGGLSDARNYGLDLAIGEYVCFVDSDDYIHKDMLKETYYVAKENGSDITTFDLYYEYDDGHKELTKGGNKPISYYEEDKDLLFIVHSANNKIFRRVFLQDKRFVYGMSYEDLASIPIWLAQANNVTYVNKALYYYMQRGTSISHSYDERIFDIYKAINNIKNNLHLSSDEVSEFYLKQGLVSIMLKIREMDNKELRREFYLKNANYLDNDYPEWYEAFKKEDYSFKWKMVALLLKKKHIKLLDRIYSH